MELRPTVSGADIALHVNAILELRAIHGLLAEEMNVPMTKIVRHGSLAERRLVRTHAPELVRKERYAQLCVMPQFASAHAERKAIRGLNVNRVRKICFFL